MTMPTPQALVRIVPRGGARSERQILDQWMYLCRRGDNLLQRSERHLGIRLPVDNLKAMAASWMQETGACPGKRARDKTAQAITTHIVASFPPGTPVDRAFAAGRAWAEEVFGSGRHGGTFDYVTVCHDDRPHPHVHLVVNRRAFEGHWLKISKRHPDLNYDAIRDMLVECAGRHGITLDASSRACRGIDAPAISYAQYRRNARAQARSEADASASPLPPQDDPPCNPKD